MTHSSTAFSCLLVSLNNGALCFYGRKLFRKYLLSFMKHPFIRWTFEIFMAARIHVVVSWFIIPCSLVDSTKVLEQHTASTFKLKLILLWRLICLWNFGNQIPRYTVALVRSILTGEHERNRSQSCHSAKYFRHKSHKTSKSWKFISVKTIVFTVVGSV
jgi:hypothetical protein